MAATNNNKKLWEMVLFILVLLSATPQAKEVDSFNLLLPTAYHSRKGHARQLIITEGGCYDWDSTNPKVVSVKGTQQGSVSDKVDSKCNSNGLVHLLHEGSFLSSVYITAKD